jgi:hypothetical protein
MANAPLWVVVAGLVMSAISLAVSLGSLAVAIGAKRQARMTATLEIRKEAISHVRDALRSLARGNKPIVRDTTTLDDLIAGIGTSPAKEDLQKARNLSALVFSREITTELDQALDREDLDSLAFDLRELITTMNNEATLSRRDAWWSRAWRWMRATG